MGGYRDSPFLAVHYVSIWSEVDDTEHLYVQVRMGHGCADRVRICYAMLCYASIVAINQSSWAVRQVSYVWPDLKLLLDNGVLLVLA